MALEIKEIIVRVNVNQNTSSSQMNTKQLKSIIYQTKKEIIEECKAYIKRIQEDKFER